MSRNVETSRRDVLPHATPNTNATQNTNYATPKPTDDLPRFNGYRIESARLTGWDYTQNAAYFVTICTRERLPFLADIVEGAVVLSEAGRIVDEEWRRTSDVRRDVTVDTCIVMPNHLHGILMLNRTMPSVPETLEKTSRRDVSTPRLVAGSLGAIVGQFKSVCTKRIRETGITDFGWQPRFHDHIIRDEKSLDDIRRYIAGNPLKWELEHDTPENLWM